MSQTHTGEVENMDAIRRDIARELLAEIPDGLAIDVLFEHPNLAMALKVDPDIMLFLAPEDGGDAASNLATASTVVARSVENDKRSPFTMVVSTGKLDAPPPQHEQLSRPKAAYCRAQLPCELGSWRRAGAAAGNLGIKVNSFAVIQDLNLGSGPDGFEAVFAFAEGVASTLKADEILQLPINFTTAEAQRFLVTETIVGLGGVKVAITVRQNDAVIGGAVIAVSHPAGGKVELVVMGITHDGEKHFGVYRDIIRLRLERPMEVSVAARKVHAATSREG